MPGGGSSGLSPVVHSCCWGRARLARSACLPLKAVVHASCSCCLGRARLVRSARLPLRPATLSCFTHTRPSLARTHLDPSPRLAPCPPRAALQHVSSRHCGCGVWQRHYRGRQREGQSQAEAAWRQTHGDTDRPHLKTGARMRGHQGLRGGDRTCIYVHIYIYIKYTYILWARAGPGAQGQ